MGSSLAIYRRTVAQEVEARCPRKAGWVLVNTDTGEVAPARCGANFCTYCGPRNAWVTGLAIALAKPERFVRLSLVGDEWQQVRGRVKRLVYNIRREGFTWYWCWHRERNPRGTGHHVHGYQWGSFVPQDLLQDLCQREGMGFPDIRRFRVRGAAVYGMKSLTYGMKGSAKGEAAHRAFLEWNGGRLVHATRGFWRDGETGVALTKRAAEKIALARHNGALEAGQWVLQQERQRT